VARVEATVAAAEDLARLTITHRLPLDTPKRVRRSIRSLARFPQLGTLLEDGGWDGFRYLLGPWRWMVIVYEYLAEEDRVVIVTIQDGRSSSAATGHR